MSPGEEGSGRAGEGGTGTDTLAGGAPGTVGGRAAPEESSRGARGQGAARSGGGRGEAAPCGRGPLRPHPARPGPPTLPGAGTAGEVVTVPTWSARRLSPRPERRRPRSPPDGGAEVYCRKSPAAYRGAWTRSPAPGRADWQVRVRVAVLLPCSPRPRRARAQWAPRGLLPARAPWVRLGARTRGRGAGRRPRVGGRPASCVRSCGRSWGGPGTARPSAPCRRADPRIPVCCSAQPRACSPKQPEPQECSVHWPPKLRHPVVFSPGPYGSGISRISNMQIFRERWKRPGGQLARVGFFPDLGTRMWVSRAARGRSAGQEAELGSEPDPEARSWSRCWRAVGIREA